MAPLQIITSKICTKCGEDKPIEDYAKHTTGKYGVTPSCKECRRRARQDPEAKIKYNAWRRASRNKNKEATNAKNRAWDRAHPEYHQGWRDKNRSKVRSQSIQYDHKRRALLADALTEPWTVEEIIERDGLVCYLCLEPVDRMQVEVDHKMPIARGGTNLKSNLGITHRSCNRKKNTKTPEEYWEVIARR